MKKAWAVVQAAGCDNAKLLLDSWHYIRADQPLDLSVLEGIPAEKIVSIQINDVQAHPYAKSILRDESMHDRMLPGTGCGNTAGFVKLIRDKGVRPAVVGVEAREGPPGGAGRAFLHLLADCRSRCWRPFSHASLPFTLCRRGRASWSLRRGCPG